MSEVSSQFLSVPSVSESLSSSAPEDGADVDTRLVPRPSITDTSRDPFFSSMLFAKFRAWRQDPRVVLGALVALAILGGYAWLQLGTPHGAPTQNASRAPMARVGTSNSGVTTSAYSNSKGGATKDVLAHIAGAVVIPGIVKLRDGQRVVDAIAAAGGARPDADLDQLNLAARVADGERIFVSVRGAPVVGSADGEAGGSSSSGVKSGPIHLNSATSSDLETLPGIGPSLASAIIKLRAERGGFRSVGDLRDVPGIGDARFAQLESSVAL